MTQYFAPGVYVEEVPAGIKPIAGVGTSTAGFVGVVAEGTVLPERPGAFELEADGVALRRDAQGNPIPVRYALAPAGEPALVTSWGEFTARFGSIQSGNFALAHAVYGFFNNGGTRCWVARIAPPAPPAPAPTKKGEAAATAPLAVAPAPPASVTADSAEALRQALAAFEAIDEIALVACPGATAPDLQRALIDHCEAAQDRFAILDGPQLADGASVTAEAVKGAAGASSYAAIYYPWITVADPAGGQVSVPPSGHIAGVYARTDAARGVYKAPANEVIRGALGTARPLSKAAIEGLNPRGVNAIRTVGGDVTVWGARTLASGGGNSEFQYVNVRRLFLFMRESIAEGTGWVVFEPNAPQLWAKIRRNVTAFLTTLWSQGALLGNTPAEAFYVRCDESTNPEDVRNLGQVVTEIGVAVVRPAEFVVFRVSQWSGPAK